MYICPLGAGRMTERVNSNGFGRRLRPGTSARTQCAVVGIRMTPDKEREVKAEAAQRAISVADLFDETWTDYVDRRPRQ